MKTIILFLSIIFIAGCVSSTQNTSTSTSAKSISSHTGINGIWKGRFEVLGKPKYQRVSFEFIQNGDTLTGTLIQGSNRTPLLDGKITGNKITFRAVFKWRCFHTKSSYEGTFNGDQLRLTWHADMGVDGSMNNEGKFRRVN